MYRDFYHLKHAPFASKPGPDAIFFTPRHKAALERIIKGIKDRQGCMALIGAAGLGKTTLLLSCLEAVDRRQLKLLYISNHNIVFNRIVDINDISKIIYQELHYEKDEKDLSISIDDLHQIFIDECTKGNQVVIVIDDAHYLSIEALMVLPRLTDVNSHKETVVQILLVGQPVLETYLRMPKLRDLRKSINIVSRMQPLTKRESKNYIKNRLENASEKRSKILSKRALKKIVKYARGIPRDLNILCTDVLLAGFYTQKNPIPARVVLRVIADFEDKSPIQLAQLAWLKAAGVLLLAGLAGISIYTHVDVLSKGVQAVAQFEWPRLHTLAEQNEVPSGTEIGPSDPPVAARAQEPANAQAQVTLVPAEDTGATTVPPVREEPLVAAQEAAPHVAQSLDVIQRVTTLMDEVFPDGGAFRLQVSTNKGEEDVYVSGDKLLVYVLAETDAYLQVDYYQADGQVVHLLPHPLDSNQVRAGQVYTLGGPENTFQFEVTPPFGLEILTVVASQRPLEAQPGVPNAERASAYLERLAIRLQGYKAQGKVAAAFIRLQTQQ